MLYQNFSMLYLHKIFTSKIGPSKTLHQKFSMVYHTKCYIKIGPYKMLYQNWFVQNVRPISKFVNDKSIQSFTSKFVDFTSV